MSTIDDDVAAAAVDLIGRAGARELQIGYLHDDVPSERAGWYAYAQYQGARITVEDKPGPAEALDALAHRVLTGAQCRCGRLVALSDEGAVAYGNAHLPDGSSWTVEEAAAAGQCRWARRGRRWEPSCPEPPGRSGR